MDVRRASADDLEAICDFGARYIPEHYGSLLGSEAAQAQVDNWWTAERISSAIEEGRVVVAAEDENIVGVGEWGLCEEIPVIWKLYVHPSHRGKGIGPRLINAIIGDLPDGTSRLRVEHFAANRRASAFYERESFTVLHTVGHPNPVMNLIWRERRLA